MKSLVRKIFKPICALWVVALLIGAILAYFVRSIGPEDVTDGLGRKLVETPTLVRFFLVEARLWAGWTWLLGWPL